MEYYYYINLNERGDFNADIRDANNTTLYEIASPECLTELVDSGYMNHYQDITSLKAYLIDMSILPADCKVYRGNEQRLYY